MKQLSLRHLGLSVAALALVTSSAFAGQKLTDKHECVAYHGNWVGAPTISCDALPMGNTSVVVPAPKKVVDETPPVEKPVVVAVK